MLAVCILAFSLLGACASKPNALKTTHADPLNCQAIPGNENHQQLCVITTVNKGDLWFVIGDGKFSQHQLIDELSFSDGSDSPISLYEFSISPGGNYLAVTVAEEGHPTLLFVPLQRILQEHIESWDLPVIATYPGGINIENWQSDNQLIVSSDQDLIDYRHGGELGEFRNFLIHLPDGTISLLSKQ